MGDRAEAGPAAAAAAGVRKVLPGMRIALGTGRAAELAIRGLAARVPVEGSWEAVASSEASEGLARSLGLTVRSLRGEDRFDVMLDGADEVAPDLSLTKGGGGALFREKLLARHSREVVILVDASKLVERLGVRRGIPVEVVPFARESVRHRLAADGAEAVLRVTAPGVPARTDNGNEILDVAFPGGVPDPAVTERALASIPGVVESGLFVGIATAVLVGHPDGRVEERRPPAPRPPGP